MKWSLLVLLLVPVAMTSCQTAHDAAVSTFRVLDAPNQYVRHKLDIDQQGDTTTTTSTTTVQANPPPNGYQQPYQQYQQQQQPPPPPPQYTTRTETVSAPPPPPPRREVVRTERTRETAPARTPTPAPRVTTRTTTRQSESTPNESTTTTSSHTTVADKASLPYAKPVPGKPGYVFSPYDKNGGYVDVTGFAPGSKVKDPYSGKVFLVP